MQIKDYVVEKDPRAKVLRAYPIEGRTQEETQADPRRVAVHMKPGSEIRSVITDPHGTLAVLVWEHPADSQLRVRHDLVIAVADNPIAPGLGRYFGAPLPGLFAADSAPASLIPELPWPGVASGAN